MTQPSQFRGGDAIDAAKDYASKHPDRADAALDKAEQVLQERTGGRLDDLISTGRDALENALGLPDDANPPAGPSDPAPQQPTPRQPTPPSDPPGAAGRSEPAPGRPGRDADHPLDPGMTGSS